MDTDTIYMHSGSLDKGGYPDDCLLDGRRSGKTLETLSSLGLMESEDTTVMEPTLASMEDLLRFHQREYLETLRAAGSGDHDFAALKAGLGTPDCPIFPGMFDYLRLAAGGTIDGARLLLERKAKRVFNYSGGFQHAGSARASGNCYINDVNIAARVLVDAGKSVLIVDLDAHHGDQVQEAFINSRQVTFVSLHEDGETLYPGTGAVTERGLGDGLGHTVNLPMPVGTFDAVYYSTFKRVVMPLIRAVSPDVLLVVAGMDALAGDPLAHLNLTNNCLSDIMGDLADTGIPMLVTGGGGYNFENTVRGWALLFSTIVNGKDEPLPMGGVMLENTAWFGGLRDRTLLSHGGFRENVERKIDALVKTVRSEIFPIHGIG